MPTLTPTVAKGRAALLAGTWRDHSDDCDKKVAGVYSHQVKDFSSSELDEILSRLRFHEALLSDNAIICRQASGSTMIAGTPVYVTDYDDVNGAFTIAKAKSDALATLAQFVLPADLLTATNGIAIAKGLVEELDTSAFADEGDKAYLDDATAGTFAAAAGDFPQEIGHVTAKSATVGAILFWLPGLARVVPLLANLLDVDASGRSGGDMLIWNDTTKRHEYAAPTDTDEKVKLDVDDPTAGYLADKIDGTTIIANEGGTIQVGSITNDNVDSDAAIAWTKISKSGAAPGDVGAAATSHNHAAGDVTSGNLALTRAPLPSKEDHTAGDTLTHASDAGVIQTNAGASAEVELTMPNPAAGVGPFRFACMDTDGLKIRMPGTFKGRNGATESSAGGYLLSTAIGSTMELIPIYDAGAAAWIWLAASATGTWSAA